MEAGARVLLIDEDTAATNLMIRDRNMQTLIAKDKEPITPFIDKVKYLYAQEDDIYLCISDNHLIKCFNFREQATDV